jgi:hypothetical protein
MSTAERVVSQFIEVDFEVAAMSNVLPEDSGVEDAVLWISPGESDGKDLAHGPRLKVVLGTKITAESLRDSVSVTIEATPRVIGSRTLPGKVKRQVEAFIHLNQDVLLRHWRGELGSKQTLNLLQPI